jgi:kinesin family protein 15
LQGQSSSNAVAFNSGSKSEIFTYDHVADTNSTQEEVFRMVGKVVADNCLQGYNGTILA